MANNKSPLHQYLQNEIYDFHPRQKYISHVTLEPTLNGDKIESVDNSNFLGVVIDKHISWKYHTEMFSNKIKVLWGAIPTKELPTVIHSQNNVH